MKTSKQVRPDADRRNEDRAMARRIAIAIRSALRRGMRNLDLLCKIYGGDANEIDIKDAEILVRVGRSTVRMAWRPA